MSRAASMGAEDDAVVLSARALTRVLVDRTLDVGAFVREAREADVDVDAVVAAARRRAMARAYEILLTHESGRAPRARERSVLADACDDATTATTTTNARCVTYDDVYLRTLRVRGEDAARALDAAVDELRRESTSSDEETREGVLRVLFALCASSERVEDVAASGVRSALAGVEVLTNAGDAAAETSISRWSATPDVGRLRTDTLASTSACAGEGAVATARDMFTLPGLQRGAVFGLAPAASTFGFVEAESDDEDDIDSANVASDDDTKVDDDGVTTHIAVDAEALDIESADKWLRAVDVPIAERRGWDSSLAPSRSSALDAEAFDVAYRRSFRPIKELEIETVIASERDCVHVALAALSGCETSAAMLAAAAAADGRVSMRFLASSTRAFQNVLKTIATSAERRCELGYVVSELCTPYMRPVANAFEEIFRAHAAALYSMADATAERRCSESDECTRSSYGASMYLSTSMHATEAADITLLELTVHTKRVRHQIDVMFHLLASERSLETHAVSHDKLLQRLQESLSHVEDEESALIQYIYARAMKPIIDGVMSWLYSATASDAANEFLIECAPSWSNLRTFDQCRIDGAVPCWLGGPFHDSPDFVETATLHLARVRAGMAQDVTSGLENDILLAGLQLRILQRLPQTREFTRAIKDAFESTSSFDAYTEQHTRDWRNRVRLLESRVLALSRECLKDMEAKRTAHAEKAEIKRVENVDALRIAIQAREEERLQRLNATAVAKKEKREGQLEELERREASRIEARERRIADERAWLEAKAEEHRAEEQRKLAEQMAKTELHVRQEDARLRWFEWQNARLALSDERLAFIRRMESEHEEAAVVKLADVMSAGLTIAPPSESIVLPFESVETAAAHYDDNDDVIVPLSITHVATAKESDTDIVSTVSNIASEVHEETFDPMVTVPQMEDTVLDSAPPPNAVTIVAPQEDAIEHRGAAADDEDITEDTAFGTPLPVLLRHKMSEIVQRQCLSIGRFTMSVFFDHLAFEAHFNAVVRFTLGGESAFFDGIVRGLERACADTRARIIRSSQHIARSVLEDALQEAGLNEHPLCERLSMRENEDDGMTFDAFNLNLCNGLTCEYALPWPLNLAFVGMNEKYALSHSQVALLQICHGARAVRACSALLHASSRSNALRNTTQTNLDLRSRRLRKLSLLVTEFQHFIDALYGHVFEAVHLGAGRFLNTHVRDAQGNIVPRDLHDLRAVVQRYCARVHEACFLRHVDTALKALVEDGLQLALDLGALFSARTAETLLTDGPAYASAQQIHAKFRALMTQLCFRVRVTSSEAAVGFIERVDFNSFYLSNTTEQDLEF
jgi:hypothetical protein